MQGRYLPSLHEFPNIPSHLILSPALKAAPYGLSAQQHDNSHLRHEIPDFEAWCQDAIRVDRDPSFRSVSSPTLDGYKDQMLGYLGFFNQHILEFGSQLSLSAYRDAPSLAIFFAFLEQREVSLCMLHTCV